MTPSREIKLGTLTTQSMLQKLRNQRTQTSSLKPSNTQDKWNTSSWNDVKAAKSASTNGNNAANLSSFTQVADAIDVLNNFFASLNTENSAQTISTSSNSSGSAKTSAGNAGVNYGANASSMEQYSGYAQGISGNYSSPAAVNTATLDSVRNAISNFGWSSTSLSNLKPDLAKEVVSANQSLAQAQADFSQLQNQKLTAEANVTRLEGQASGAKTESETAKSSLDNNKSSLNSSVQARDKMDEQLSSVNEEFNNACTNVKTQEKNKSSAQKEVSTAKSAVAKSEAAVNTAVQSLETAKSALSSTPKTLEDGTPNPQYETAKAAVSKAETEKQQAEKSLEEAKNSQQAAEQKLSGVEDELKQAQQAKDSVLKTLQKDESKYKELAQKCDKMQDTVEQNQQQYDQSLQVYDDTTSNYERLNSELEAQQGILTQYEAVEKQVEALKSSAESVNELSKKLDERIKEVKQQEAGSDGISPEKKSQIEGGILTNANATEGCSADKTPLENMIACKDADLSKITGKVLTPGSHIQSSSAELDKLGYLKNQDGSFTDPRTGVTIVNFNGDDWHWAPTNALTSRGQVGEYYNHDLAGRDWPGAVSAAERAETQANVTLDGFDDNGQPKFKWKNFSRTSI